jgi:3',5'-cyclic AMP phosphodiesterase CpdA
VKFIHAADIHLDSPFAGLTDAAEAPIDRLKGCTRQALTNLVDYALENEIDFVVIAGDLYDGDWRDYATGLFFAKEMGRQPRCRKPDHQAARAAGECFCLSGQGAAHAPHP